MMEIQLTNTASRKKEPFKLAPGKRISMYVCGITPYDHAHLGHLLSAVRFDIVRRYLLYKGYHVQFVENITDIDDKIIARAKELETTPADLVEPYIAEYHEFRKTYHLLAPDKNPRVTQYIPEIISYIERIIENGAAYVSWSGNVYFEVEKDSDYGKLSGGSPKEVESSGRIEQEPDKRDSHDFALWKRDSFPGAAWDSPWGRGRPGWHIECSVMANTLLGNPIDIHGGGLDLIFPHHENELAQAEARNNAPFVRHWLHSGLLMVDGAKMSKSLKNFITIPEAHERYGVELLKFVMLRFHYRSPMAFSEQLLKENMNTVRAFAELFRLGVVANEEKREATGAFQEAMNDDFNTPEALVVLTKAMEKAAALYETGKMGEFKMLAGEIRALCDILGLFQSGPYETLEELLSFHRRTTGKKVPDLSTIEKRLKERDVARDKKDFKISDQVRAELEKDGLKVLDTPHGSRWQFDISN